MNRRTVKLLFACLWAMHAAILFFPEGRAVAQYLHSNGYYAFHGYPDQYYTRQWVSGGYGSCGYYQYVRYYPQSHYQAPAYSAAPAGYTANWRVELTKADVQLTDMAMYRIEKAILDKKHGLGGVGAGIPLPGGAGYAGYTYSGSGYQQVALGSTTWGYGAYPGVSAVAESLKLTPLEMAQIAKQMNDGALAYTSLTYDEAMKFFAARAKDGYELAQMEMKYKAFIATFGPQPSTVTSGYSYKKEPTPAPNPAPGPTVKPMPPADSSSLSPQEKMAVLAQVLDNNCTTCHSKEFGKYVKGGFNIDDAHDAAKKTLVFKKEDQDRVTAYIDAKKCPQSIEGAPVRPLSAQEINVLKGKF